MFKSSVRSYRRGNHGSFRYPRGFSGSNRSPKVMDVRSFINKAEDFPALEVIPIEHKFTDFALDNRILTNIYDKGYQTPTPIQDQGIGPIMQGRDILGLANTGTGKTGSFLIPLLNKVILNKNHKVLILVPTRELAIQINHEFIGLANRLSVYSAMAIGGTSMYQQRKSIQMAHNFLICTPGRLKDLANQRLINLYDYSTVVLDEVDRMLDMGFIHDVRKILSLLPNPKQSLFFSATMSNPIMQLIHEFSSNLQVISVKQSESVQAISQDVITFSSPDDKMDKLHKLLISPEVEKALIFGRTKHGIQNLANKLLTRGFKADAIHGNKSQPQRQRALLNFRQNRIKILCATDVAARGVDIPDVSHVINYDVPGSKEDYIHRIGRTGRANKKGIALTFVNN